MPNNTVFVDVHDKSSIIPFVRGLNEMGWKIVSTDETAEYLRREGIEITRVARTLLFNKDIQEIRMMVVNLGWEPAEGKSFKVMKKADVYRVAFILAAAKDYQSTIVVTDPEQYNKVLNHLQKDEGKLPPDFFQQLAREAFFHTAWHLATISEFLKKQDVTSLSDKLPDRLLLRLVRGPIFYTKRGKDIVQSSALYLKPGSPFPFLLLSSSQANSEATQK